MIQEKIYDNLSYNVLKTYIDSINYPYTTSCLNFYKIHILLNDLLLNHRCNYLELGSGLSTLVLGQFIRINNLKCKIISFEHDKHFYDLQLKQISNLKLSNIIDLCFAPLKTQRVSKFNCNWYDEEVIVSNIGNEKYDLMLIDGPPAYLEDISYNRFPALPKLFNMLDRDFSIYVDDTNRKGESNAIRIWEKSFNIKFRHVGPTFRHCSNGKFINTLI